MMKKHKAYVHWSKLGLKQNKQKKTFRLYFRNRVWFEALIGELFGYEWSVYLCQMENYDIIETQAGFWAVDISFVDIEIYVWQRSSLTPSLVILLTSGPQVKHFSHMTLQKIYLESNTVIQARHPVNNPA